MHALQNRCDSLQAHASVYGGLGQLQHLAIGSTVVLHEHHVPDFDVAITILFRRARRSTSHIRAVIVEDFGTGAAGTGIAHLPEVVRGVTATLVIADPDDTVSRNSDFLVPDIEGFVIFGVYGYPEFLLGQVQPVLAGQKCPGVVDRFALEVVTEAEVAQHFEEGVVTSGVAHVFQVVVLATRADAFLGGGCPGVVTLFTAQEQVLELVHSRIRKQQCGVVRRYQRTTWNNGVALLLEIIEERLSQLCGFHSPLIPFQKPGGSAARSAIEYEYLHACANPLL